MKVLTIKQPWASLIMFHGKDIENRDWPAPPWLIGKRIGIHSSKKVDPFDHDDAMDFVYSRGLPNFDLVPTRYDAGCILGTVLLKDCVRESDSLWFIGDYGFVLADPQPFAEPIPYRGALGFWDWIDPAIRGIDKAT